MLPFIGMMLLTLIIGTIAAAVVDEGRSRRMAALFTGLTMIIAFGILVYSLITGSVNVHEDYIYYMVQFAVDFNFQLNIISFSLLLMATIVSFITALSGNTEHEREKTSSVLILLFELSAVGLFASANLIMFFLFWDVGVVALFFMLYLLGSANRRHAAMKFIVYEILASMLLLFAIMLLYFYTPVHSFDINTIIQNSPLIPTSTQWLVFFLLAGAFLINMPVFPAHLWLPDAHTEASTQGSMLLSGILTKFGGYGMILTFLLVPSGYTFSGFLGLLAGFSAFYAAFALMTQHDIKRIIAYTTIVEMSIILLGIASQNVYGTTGATYAMLAHGFGIAMLFLAAGSIGYMFSDRDFRALRGIIKSSVSTGYTMLIGIFATTGVPLTAAFIGDVLIFTGVLKAFSVYATIPLFSLLLAGAYLYYVINKSVLSTKDVTQNVEYIAREQKLGYSMLMFFIFFFGVLPFILLNFFSV